MDRVPLPLARLRSNAPSTIGSGYTLPLDPWYTRFSRKHRQRLELRRRLIRRQAYRLTPHLHRAALRRRRERQREPLAGCGGALCRHTERSCGLNVEPMQTTGDSRKPRFDCQSAHVIRAPPALYPAAHSCKIGMNRVKRRNPPIGLPLRSFLRPHRLVAQDSASSRRQHRFESFWGRHRNRHQAARKGS